MIPLLDRYVVREMALPLLFGLAMFSTLLVVATALLKLVALLSRGAPLWAISELFCLRWVSLLPFVLPMAVLLAALLAFGRLSSDSELVAIQAAGTPLLRVGAAAMVIGLLLSVGSLLINERIVPTAARRAHRLEMVIQAAIKGGVRELDPERGFFYQDVERGVRQRTFNATRFDVDAGRMENVVFLEYAPDGNTVNLLVEAKWCEWDEADPTRWIFHDGQAKYLEQQTLQRYQVVQHFSEWAVKVNRTPKQIRASLKEPEEMTYYELSDYIEDLKRQGVSPKKLLEMEVERHRKLADPFICLVFALIGTPLGIRRQRGGTAVGLGLSILIVFGFYLLWSSARVLGENGTLPPLAASWVANGVGFLVGLGFTWRATR
ncbi:MAG: LptF/LptG family permease [Armatimonadetes bacterium]|nr:LptF/LptG family permease [Armatimonadota bacterium]